MRRMLFFSFSLFFLFSGIAGAGLYEGSWDTTQIGAMPGGDTLRNGEYHQDWHGTWPIGIGSEVVWTSMGDNGTQWTIQGTKTSGTIGTGWFAVEGANTYYYQPMESTYTGDGQLLFDGDLYTGSGWTGDTTYKHKYLVSGGTYSYVGAIDSVSDGYGVFDNAPFDIHFTMIFQQDGFSSTEPRWDEGHSTYFKIDISQVPIPAAFWLFSSGLMGLIGIRSWKSTNVMKSFFAICSLFCFVLLSFNLANAANIAPLYGTTTASSEYSEYWDSQYAIDGDSSTAWTAVMGGGPNDPQWIIVDLQNQVQITRIDLLFSQYIGGPFFGYTNEYNLYTSIDGADWSFVGSGILTEHTDPELYTDIYAISGDSLRYVKYEVVGGTHWASITEIETYDTSAVPIPAAVWLLGSGLIGLVGIRRRIHK
jgi:hypothetical protein